jgi:hypothetical protein
MKSIPLPNKVVDSDHQDSTINRGKVPTKSNTTMRSLLLFFLLLSGVALSAESTFSVVDDTCPNYLVSEGDLDTTLCHGGIIYIGETLFDNDNTSGQIMLEGQAAEGGDSIVNVSVSFWPSAVSTYSVTICSNDSVEINGVWYQTDEPIPTLIPVGINANGCDSTIAVAVTVIDEMSGLCDYLGEPDTVMVMTGDAFTCDSTRLPVCLENGEGAVGEEICIPLTASNWTDISALQAVLCYDLTGLTFTMIRVLTEGFPFFNDPATEVVVTDSTITFVTTTPMGEGTTYADGEILAEVCFLANTPGIYEFTTDSTATTEIVYSDGSTEPFNINTGVITVSCPPSVDVDYTTICAGDSLEWVDGNTYTESGQYAYEDQTDTLCPILRILRLRIFGENAMVTCDPPLCGPEGTTVLEVTNVSGTYDWSNGATASSITVSESGAYSVTVTSTDGCTKVLTTNVFRRELPDATISGSQEICPGASVELAANTGEGYTYLWSTGDTTQTTTVTEAGEYTVEVTNSFGCSETNASFEVLLLPDVVFEIIQSSDYVCVGETTQVLITGNVSVLWADGSTEVLRQLGAGTYSVTVTDNLPGSCPVTTTVTVLEEQSFSVSCPSDKVVIIVDPTGETPSISVFGDQPELTSNCLIESSLEVTLPNGGSVTEGVTVVTATGTNLQTGEVKICSFTITATLAGPLAFTTVNPVAPIDGIFCPEVRIEGLSGDALEATQLAYDIPDGIEILTVVPSAWLTTNYPGASLDWSAAPETGRLMVIIIAETGSPITAEDATALFTIKTRATVETSAGDCFLMSVHETLAESVLTTAGVVTPAVHPVEMCLPREFQISIQVLRTLIFDQDPVEEVETNLINANGDTLATVMTDADGVADFGMWPGDVAYRIVATKDGDDARFLSVADEWYLRQVLFGMIPLTSPYVYTASNTEYDAFLTLADASTIRAVILGFVEGFPLNMSWVICHSGDENIYTLGDDMQTEFYIAQLTEDLNLAFTGIKVGDEVPTIAGNIIDPGGNTTSLGMTDVVYAAGQVFEVVILVADNSMQLPLGLNDNIKLVNAELMENDLEDRLDNSKKSYGNFLYYTAGNPAKNATGQAIKLTFKAQAAGQLSEDLSIKLDAPNAPELVTRTGEVMTPELRYNDPEGNAELTVTVLPNPVVDIMQIRVSAPDNTDYTARVVGGTGRSLLTERSGTGSSVISLDMEALPSGLYIAVITTEDGVQITRRVVKR